MPVFQINYCLINNCDIIFFGISRRRNFMKFRDLLLKNRSYRRFFQKEKIELETLKEIISNVRLAPSPANLQPLKFIIVNNQKINEDVFKCIKWAGYLKDWHGPEQGEKPSAYIIMIGNQKISSFVNWDYGISLQTILLSSTEKGYGGCAIAAFNKQKIREMFKIPDEFEIAAIIALGKPKEKVIIEDVKDGDIKYWRDEDQVHHVPKRKLDDLIYKIWS